MAHPLYGAGQRINLGVSLEGSQVRYGPEVSALRAAVGPDHGVSRHFFKSTLAGRLALRARSMNGCGHGEILYGYLWTVGRVGTSVTNQIGPFGSFLGRFQT